MSSPSFPETDVSELLLRWQESRQTGQPASAEEVCSARPELLAELKRRIAALQAMQQRLALGTVSGRPDGDSSANPTLAEPSKGAQPMPEVVPIAGYELMELLDQGGMGTVYKARQVDLKRLVALKMIRTDVSTRPEHLARFRVEAQAVAQLQHPHIVQIYEIGEASGRPYFSMEFVQGGSLAQKLRGQPVSPQLAAELVATVAEAVHFAHQRGVVHRDLKPANILLEAQGSPSLGLGNPKIADFGLAKRLNSEAEMTALSRQTQSGMILGTPSYMSPEQAAGNPAAIGPATDVYALGAILYEMLTGRPPFTGASPLDTLLQVMAHDPMPPSRAQPRVPRDLETICMKCLEKLPERRYATAAALADDLRRYGNGLPISARSISPVRRFAKMARRRPDVSALAAVLVLALLSWLGWAGWHSYRASEESRVTAAQLAPQARVILQRYCWSCHGQDPAHIEGDLDVLNHATLIDRARGLVVPHDIPGSRLIHRIEDNSMPPEEEEEFPRLASAEIESLKKWVAAGAPAFAPIGPGDRPAAPKPNPLGVAVKKIFQESCYDCHRLGSPKNNGIKILNHDLLVSKRKVIVPGDPGRSALFQALLSKDTKKVMPPPDGGSALTDEEIDTVRQWISEGAPPFPRTHHAKEKQLAKP
jgi:serine/threonine protein kinase